MNNIVQEPISNDEVNLYDYWKVIVKRKWLLIGVFLAITITTVVVNLFVSKIYRGEYIVKLATGDFTDVVKRINDDPQSMKSILPKTYLSAHKIELIPIKDSIEHKLQILIDVRDASNISAIASELIEHISNFPYYKRSVEQGKERLEKQLEELSIAIFHSEGMLKTYNILFKSEKLVPLGFNPIELYNGIFNLKTKKIILEQSLQNHKGIEVITQFTFSQPVKPRIIMNIALSAFIGLFAGIVLVFFVESVKKDSTLPVNTKEQ